MAKKTEKHKSYVLEDELAVVYAFIFLSRINTVEIIITARIKIIKTKIWMNFLCGINVDM